MNARVAIDVVVVGRGMIGTAAARHLAESGVRVALVGPTEPVDVATATSPLASHYDEARITRVSDPDPVWADLAAASIARYPDITSRSGIEFHQQTGLVRVAADPVEGVASARARGARAESVEVDWVRTTYGIQLRAGEGVFRESDHAGLVSPRKLVAAQTALAEAAGAVVIDATVTSLQRAGTDHVLQLHGSDATQQLRATQVILATGAYGSTLCGVDVAIERRLRTVVLVELAPGPSLPCLIVEDPEPAALERLYWTPPVPYPDGRNLLKIGGSVLPLQVAQRDQDIADWFRVGGSRNEAQTLRQALRSLLPDRAVLSTGHRPCVMAYTPSQLPSVGLVDDGVVVALGGNGSAAKSSDELGRLAASLISPELSNADQVDLAQLAPSVQT